LRPAQPDRLAGTDEARRVRRRGTSDDDSTRVDRSLGLVVTRDQTPADQLGGEPPS
jgi:hypothetical protein